MHKRAAANLAALKANTYPGRVVWAGLDETGNYVVQGCVIMGRSVNSRNRVYRQDGGRVYTDLAQPDPKADISLIIYNAMDEEGNKYVASNGVQTDTVIENLRRGKTFVGALNSHTYEPDPPNFTPRITVVCSVDDTVPRASFSLIHKDPDSGAPNRPSWNFPLLIPGTGYYLSTYRGALSSFEGSPRPLPLLGSMESLADMLWGTLNTENRVGLALKFIEIASGASNVTLRNKHHGD